MILSSLSLIVAAPVAFSQNSPFQEISERCISDTQKKLEKLGLTASEENSDYDMKFEETYRECMTQKGMPVQADGEEIPLTGDEALPQSEVKE